MEQTTLKYLRIFVPGIIFFLGFYPIFLHYFGGIYEIKSLDFSYLTIICILIGSIYYQTDIQRFITYFTLSSITTNILTKLLQTYKKALTEPQKAFIKNDDKFLHLFYKLIDNDESLKKKQNNVYFNGIFWTSTADLIIFSAFFCILYKFVFFEVPRAKILSNIFFFMTLLASLLHILAVLKHLRLSNNQLSFIDVHKKQEVTTYFDDILQQMPTPAVSDGPKGPKSD